MDVDKLISPDFNSGLMVDLVTQVNGSAHEPSLLVMYLHSMPWGSWFIAPIHTLLDRYQQFAETTDGVAYVPGRELFSHPVQRL